MYIMRNQFNSPEIEKLEKENALLNEKLVRLLHAKGQLEYVQDLVVTSKGFRYWQNANKIKRFLKRFFYAFPMTPRIVKLGLVRRFIHFNSSVDETSLYKKYDKTSNKGLPLVSIVSAYYKKKKEISYFLEALKEQDYRGKIEIIFVDDASPDATHTIIKNFLKMVKAEKNTLIKNISIIRNKKNLGNCLSRNLAIKEARGEIIVIIDSDCLTNKRYISSIVAAHLYNDCDVVIGPLNIETASRSPKESLDYYEKHSERILTDAQIQDSINKNSFLNCITRNFSIRKSFIAEHYGKELFFDPDFSYSMSDKKSGFGWEDVEMAYRLYKRGARIKFIKYAYTIHISHPSATGKDEEKPYRSLLNFRRLYEKHPELLYVTRRWTLDTYGKILNWAKSYRLKENDDKKFLDNRFQKYIPAPFYIKSSRKLRILTHKWHCSHQYELYKLPYEFNLVTNDERNHTNIWEYNRRPLSENAKMVPIEDINEASYDFAIAHFDENILAYKHTNNVLGSDWGAMFRWFIKNVNIPKIVICHGTPQFYGQYDFRHKRENINTKVIESSRKQLVDYLRDTLVIVNSYQAQREWRFNHSKVIWQGFDPTEFPPALYQKGILTLGKMMEERPHYRGYYLFNKVFNNKRTLDAERLLVPEPDILYDRQGNEYAYSKYQNYINAIRQHSIYFNPTLRSPMPRSRGEAMMCGLATVSAKNHDVELFIKNGENGFYADEPDELREYLAYLRNHPEQTKKIGMAGRMTAMDLFNHDRYLQAWEDTITKLLS
ncbi:hypothetical protein A2957_00335 [Candidatus Roizmanbacteria bacterium RIFCSPLOWO2_01_FULL_38_11]|uniref:Uncharacterized protein n=1 Tax=Candidatus Roizmanbacteria bacterium RIFCSPLOWO2_01_FULL_38_11 TaxID=1802060 RepID=A0A1F7IK33_9BACT|nr:MAG: hypothetical protein A2957_00335 [Candidatus Roizmanbacteria bacterium RIFCSPLOWO2_01_FULL_38_11]